MYAQAAAAEGALSTLAQAGILGAFCVVFLAAIAIQTRYARQDREKQDAERVKSDERWVALLDRYHKDSTDLIAAQTSSANATQGLVRAVDAAREAIVQASNVDAQNAANMKQALELLARRQSTQNQPAIGKAIGGE